jgi:hypothetical protein
MRPATPRAGRDAAVRTALVLIDSGNWLARTNEIRYPLALSICSACLPEVSLARPEDNLYFFPWARLPRLPDAVSGSSVIASGPCVLPVMIGLFGTVS